MKADLRQLDRDGSLRAFLELTDAAEAKAFYACYKKKGSTNQQINEWWGDICDRVLPNLPAPEPDPLTSSKLISSRIICSKCGEAEKRIKDKKEVWDVVCDKWYTRLLLSKKLDDIVLYGFRDIERATEILEETYGDVKHPARYLLLLAGRNFEENNIEPKDSMKLSILTWLDYFLDEDFLDEGFYDEKQLKKQFEPVCDYFKIRPNTKGVRKALDRMYEEYNPRSTASGENK